MSLLREAKVKNRRSVDHVLPDTGITIMIWKVYRNLIFLSNRYEGTAHMPPLTAAMNRNREEMWFVAIRLKVIKQGDDQIKLHDILSHVKREILRSYLDVLINGIRKGK